MSTQPQPNHSHLPDRILRWPQVHAMTGLSRSEVWRRERDGRFPRRRKLGPQQVGWLMSELVRWLDGLERA
jgi:prophage regulatory protein